MQYTVIVSAVHWNSKYSTLLQYVQYTIRVSTVHCYGKYITLEQ
jgi:hypothetical protein